MFSPAILSQIYFMCGLVGSGFIIVNFVLGQIDDGSSAGGDAGSVSDGGAAGGHDFGAADDGGVASGHDFGAADDGGAAGGHDFGAADDGGAAGGHDFGAADDGGTVTGSHVAGASSAFKTSTGTYALSSVRTQPSNRLITVDQSSDQISAIGYFILGLLSPMGIAIFLTFFGVTGYFLLHFFPVFGFLTIVPAIVVAVCISQLFKSIIRWMIKHLQGSSLKTADLVGQIAEVNIPIHKGRTGEITYIINSLRHSSAAIASRPDVELERGAKVMIVDADKPLLLVEPYAPQPWEEGSANKS
jgi:hypothetical protein